MQKISKKIAATFLLMVVIFSSLLGFAKPVYAIQILGTGVSYNEVVAIVKEAKVPILEGINRAFVTTFLNKALQKYKVNSYLQYIGNLADTVYVGDQIVQNNPKETYKIKKIIEKIRHPNASTAATDAELDKIYAKEAADNAAKSKLTPEQQTRESSADFLLRVNQAQNFLANTSQGRKLLATNVATEIMSTADAAARLSLQGGAYKDSYECRPTGTDSTQRTASTVSCAIKNPANYIATQINSKIEESYGNQTKPNDAISGFVIAIASRFANKLADKIFNTNARTTLGEDVSTNPSSSVTPPPDEVPPTTDSTQ